MHKKFREYLEGRRRTSAQTQIRSVTYSTGLTYDQILKEFESLEAHGHGYISGVKKSETVFVWGDKPKAKTPLSDYSSDELILEIKKRLRRV